MDWSAIFAGIASLIAIIGLFISVQQYKVNLRQYQDTVRQNQDIIKQNQQNMRREFLLQALEKLSLPYQREGRKVIFHLRDNPKEKEAFKAGIISGDVIYSEEYSNLRAVFTLFHEIGYFALELKGITIDDARALFPQVDEIWEITRSLVYAIRERPNQSKSFIYFEKLAENLREPKAQVQIQK